MGKIIYRDALDERRLFVPKRMSIGGLDCFLREVRYRVSLLTDAEISMCWTCSDSGNMSLVVKCYLDSVTGLRGCLVAFDQDSTVSDDSDEGFFELTYNPHAEYPSNAPDVRKLRELVMLCIRYCCR